MRRMKEAFQKGVTREKNTLRRKRKTNGRGFPSPSARLNGGAGGCRMSKSIP